jgi:hypothetical protein
VVARGGRHGRLPDAACRRVAALFVLLPLILIIVGFLLGLFELAPPR